MKIKQNTLKILLLIISVVLVLALFTGYQLYKKIFVNNVRNSEQESFYLYIPNNGNFQGVLDSLNKHSVLIDMYSFKWVAEKKKYNVKIKPGRYEIRKGHSNNQIVNMLRSGNQKPVKLTFNSIRTKNELAGKVAVQLEFDSLSFINILNDNSFLSPYGFNKETVISMFIPNTYEIYWNITPEDFFKKMYKEYEKFWNKDRVARLEKIRMNRIQVATLASIVQAEQSVHRDEQAKIAGVYMNRIKTGMHLESCPTLVFAMGDFTRQRILNRDKEIESPYNTYKYPGLPPAPINLPEISALDAVLNYVDHDYLFLCAKDDFSGYHYFSSTFSEHNRYAQKYQMALNRKGIKH